MEPRIEAYSDEFRSLLAPGAALQKLAGGMTFTEGPVWMPSENALLFSDVPASRIMRWSDDAGLTVFREPTAFTNGNTVDLEGRLVSCETGGRRIQRTEHDGSITTLADSHDGGRLNSPNDVVVKSDGSVWFTDPDYGLRNPERSGGASKEQARNFVFRIDPRSRDVTPVARDFVMPNGLAFSPDESVLYVADSGLTAEPGGPHHIRAIEVVDGRTLGASRVVCEVSPHVPDGFRVDAGGRIFTSAGDGVQVFTPAGELLGKLLTPEVVTNCAFGGINGRTLYMTATTSLYSVELATPGATYRARRRRAARLTPTRPVIGCAPTFQGDRGGRHDAC